MIINKIWINNKVVKGFKTHFITLCPHHLYHMMQRDGHPHNTRMHKMWKTTRKESEWKRFFFLCLLRFCRLVQWGSGQRVICANLGITSRSHAAAARHGMRLTPLQERSGAHRNDHHRINLSAGLVWERERGRQCVCMYVCERKRAFSLNFLRISLRLNNHVPSSKHFQTFHDAWLRLSRKSLLLLSQPDTRGQHDPWIAWNRRAPQGDCLSQHAYCRQLELLPHQL